MENERQRRRRPALSCVECRRRKVRCDRAVPCKHCIAAKIPCNYNAAPRTFSTNSTSVGTPNLSTPGTVSAAGQLDKQSSSSRPNIVESRNLRHGFIFSEAQSSRRPPDNGPENTAEVARPKFQDSSESEALLLVAVNSASKFQMKKTRVAGWSDRMGNDLVLSPCSLPVSSVSDSLCASLQPSLHVTKKHPELIVLSQETLKRRPSWPKLASCCGNRSA